MPPEARARIVRGLPLRQRVRSKPAEGDASRGTKIVEVDPPVTCVLVEEQARDQESREHEEDVDTRNPPVHAPVFCESNW